MASVHFQDEWITVIQGDCRDGMRLLPERSVQCVITSPPFFGLRDYGTAIWVGGDVNCKHDVRRWDGPKQTQGAMSGHASEADRLARQVCRCGAIREDEQIGLEPTVELYVEHLVEIFREVWRVLRDDGIAWLNLGDAYANTGGHTKLGGTSQRQGRSNVDAQHAMKGTIPPGLKPKDLIGVPWRVAFALQADGWYLRSDVVWAKPNPTPESVEDRPTRSHEFIFLLTKNPRYFYDHIAVKEPASESTIRSAAGRMTAPTEDREFQHDTQTRMGKRSPNRVWSDPDAMARMMDGRNRRDVWTISTKPYPGAHYAVFPHDLVEPMIKAGTSEGGCCSECGTPWVRVQSLENHDTKTLGWQRACEHEKPAVPCVVLDPFGGSGTVAMVAQQLSRRAITIDLNPEYLDQQMLRNAQQPLGL